MTEKLDAWMAIAGGIVVLVGAVVAVGRWLRRQFRPMAEFVEDWRGEPSRPGVAPRPGVMPRLATIEQQTALIPGIDQRLSAVEHELHPNSGASLRDAINRVDRRTREAMPAAGEDPREEDPKSS